MKKSYCLNIVYPFDDSMYPAYDKLIEAEIGYADGSGAGWGERDMQYDFETKTAALAAKCRIDSLKLKEVKTSIH